MYAPALSTWSSRGHRIFISTDGSTQYPIRSTRGRSAEHRPDASAFRRRSHVGACRSLPKSLPYLRYADAYSTCPPLYQAAIKR